MAKYYTRGVIETYQHADGWHASEFTEWGSDGVDALQRTNNSLYGRTLIMSTEYPVDTETAAVEAVLSLTDSNWVAKDGTLGRHW